MPNDETRLSSTRASHAPSARPGERFVAGAVLAGRYRIVGLVGKGGMGEVYKADDLRLEQPVALKFLPETIGLNAAALARFHAEVRIGRQVSHPNVCRVHDVGDVDGLHFLTMEFIDGEDLASLLRRIGRLPSDKAIEIARQICAGLAAAHEAGVLHRDLKPANVMIDGRGRARLTDFGIAALARDMQSEPSIAGTPAYMAPELLKGQDASVRSDVYALGLVLYELFTGKRAVPGSVLEDVARHHDSGSGVTPPSRLVSDVDPVVERAILRCLEADPALRPASAMHVSASLPGGDPLRAALAAGETPSPEMVAAAGSHELLSARIGLALLAALIVFVIAGAALRARTAVPGRVPIDLPPAVLVHKAQEVLAAIGYPERPRDWTHGFDYDEDLTRFLRTPPVSAGQDLWARLESGRPPIVRFWYRGSPSALRVDLGNRPVRLVEPGNPPLTEPGMTLVRLDPKGRLIGFRSVPTPNRADAATVATVDWAPVFAAAGLDVAAFTGAEPTWRPDVPFDAREAWTGEYPGSKDPGLHSSDAGPQLEIRIEAAAYLGRPVALEIFGPWRPVTQAVPDPVSGPEDIPFVIMLVVASFFAWRHVRAGRSDQRAAMRIAIVFTITPFIGWFVAVHHVADAGAFGFFRRTLGIVLVNVLGTYLNYLAIEPYIRKYWPNVLIAWTRAFRGQLRDPLVGREALIGLTMGAAWFACSGALIGMTGGFSTLLRLDALVGSRHAINSFGAVIGITLFVALLLCSVVLVLRVVLRRGWIAGAAFALIAGAIGGASPGMPWSPVAGVSAGLLAALFVFAMTRFGLIAAVGVGVAFGILAVTPVTLDMSAWYAPASMLTLVALIALAGYACYLAVGGRSTSAHPRHTS